MWNHARLPHSPGVWKPCRKRSRPRPSAIPRPPSITPGCPILRRPSVRRRLVPAIFPHRAHPPVRAAVLRSEDIATTDTRSRGKVEFQNHEQDMGLCFQLSIVAIVSNCRSRRIVVCTHRTALALACLISFLDSATYVYIPLFTAPLNVSYHRRMYQCPLAPLARAPTDVSNTSAFRNR